MAHITLKTIPDCRQWRKLVHLDVSPNDLTDARDLAALPRLTTLLANHDRLTSAFQEIGCTSC